MNRFLFDALTFINGFLAIAIIAICSYAGLRSPMLASIQPLGLILGVLMGITIAAIVCGTLAFFALMERHMRTIAEGAHRPGDQLFARDVSNNSQRQEPIL